MAIIAVVTFSVDVARRDQFISAASEVMQATHTEPGCTLYRFGADFDDPTMFYITEIWDSPEQLEAHHRTAHAKAASEIISRIARIASQRVWSGDLDTLRDEQV